MNPLMKWRVTLVLVGAPLEAVGVRKMFARLAENASGSRGRGPRQAIAVARRGRAWTPRSRARDAACAERRFNACKGKGGCKTELNACKGQNDCIGCDCASVTCEDAFRLSEGWQNQTQVQRLLWDMIDSSTDSGQDDTNESISSFVGFMAGMPCSEGTLHVDGTCNEPNNKLGSVLVCTPPDDTDVQSAPHQGTRHSYNVWDLAELIPGDQGSERTLNCVQGATD
jgi:hypothetical protein